jgi:signal transduction histidine kinase
MLTDTQMIRSVFLIPVGMFVFVLFQSFALARRFTMAFSSVEVLSDKLEEQNEILQADMAEHIRLEHEIELVAEKERRAISRELHDGLCQQLTAARLHCSVLRRENKGRNKAVSGIEEMAGLLHGAVDHAYELSRGLWPVEHEERDLVSSLEGLVGKLRSSQPLEVSISCELACEHCHNANASPIFYIVREALQNVCKHASATRVQIVLDCRSVAQTLILRIEDDGVGRIDKQSSSGGLGLRIMAHRARSIGGELTIADRPGGGTVVSLAVPCAIPDCPQLKEADS